MIRTITITLSEDVYAQLEARAQTATRSVEDVVRETLTRSLPPAPEPNCRPPPG